MPIKRRISKQSDYRITPQAVEAFRRGDTAELGRALGLKPWQPNPLEVYEPNPPTWAKGSPWADFWPVSRDLRAKLMEAGR